MKEKKPCILVVDDSESILQILTRILEKQGYDVVTAGTGKEAMEKLERQACDLALVDLRLPDMDGAYLLSLLHSSNPKMKKILMTGLIPDENLRVLSERADAHLVKPFQTEELLRVIKDVSESKS